MQNITQLFLHSISAMPNCEFMNNHHGRKFLTTFIHFELCSAMFKVISDIMAHWYAITQLYLQFISAMHIKVIVH